MDMIFQESFNGCPGFQLHEVTREDILALVQHSLTSIELYTQMWETESKNKKRWFEEGIVDKSDGVFLWVSLTFKVIEDGLVSGDQLPQLEAKIDSLPKELRDFFLHLFSSIHKSDHKEAYTMLKVALQTPDHWPVLRYAFIEDYLENPDFAYGFIQPLAGAILTDRLQRARRKVYGKCRGFLKIHSVDLNLDNVDSDHYSSDEKVFDEGFSNNINAKMEGLRSFQRCVQFTHRSILEFLTSEKIKAKIETWLGKFDLLDALCQTFLAHVKAIQRALESLT
jgi:hypothetical protein